MVTAEPMQRPTGARAGADAGGRAWFAPPACIKKVKRAMLVAAVNGGLLLAGAAVSALAALADPWSLVAAGVLGGFGAAELVGRSRLRRLDLSGPRLLAMNQTALAVVLGAYFGWKAVDTWRHPPAIPAQYRDLGDADLNAAFATTWHDMMPVMIGAYGVIAVLTVLACGLNGWYYATRGRWVREALALRSPPQHAAGADPAAAPVPPGA